MTDSPKDVLREALRFTPRGDIREFAEEALTALTDELAEKDRALAESQEDAVWKVAGDWQAMKAENTRLREAIETAVRRSDGAIEAYEFHSGGRLMQYEPLIEFNRQLRRAISPPPPEQEGDDDGRISREMISRFHSRSRRGE